MDILAQFSHATINTHFLTTCTRAYAHAIVHTYTLFVKKEVNPYRPKRASPTKILNICWLGVSLASCLCQWELECLSDSWVDCRFCFCLVLGTSSKWLQHSPSVLRRHGSKQEKEMESNRVNNLIRWYPQAKCSRLWKSPHTPSHMAEASS